MPNLKTRTNTVAERTLHLEGSVVTVAIKPVVKRGIIINHPSPKGVISYTLTDSNGDWCGEGRIKADHYNDESLQFLRGFLDLNCAPTLRGVSVRSRALARRKIR
jgi:hypothetical protein